ncbi:unnamed protein product [Rotaria magnacalcarata]|nr:unnamed protein product [Rotaria magnacalcarata]
MDQNLTLQTFNANTSHDINNEPAETSQSKDTTTSEVSLDFDVVDISHPSQDPPAQPKLASSSFAKKS